MAKRLDTRRMNTPDDNDTSPSPSVRIYSQDALTLLPLSEVFGNMRPVEIDLGCGKGRFLLAHARDHSEINFLGIDRMLRRIRKVDRKAVRTGQTNVRLLRMEGYYAVSYLIPAESISAYFILFPDPWPKAKHHDHRLFNPRFIRSLHRTLKPSSPVHIATDHLPYFSEIHEKMSHPESGFTEVDAWEPRPHERTDFELRFLEHREIGRATFIKQPPEGCSSKAWKTRKPPGFHDQLFP